jgi:hypothetical protein
LGCKPDGGFLFARMRRERTNDMRHKHVKEESRSTLLGRDHRFQQMLDLAHGGDDAAIHDLWAEFQYDFAQEGGRHDLN